MKTIAQQLNVKDFPFIINDKNGDTIYYEYSDGFWIKREYDSNGNQTYFEYSDGFVYSVDNKPKNTFSMKELADKLGVPIETLRIKD